MKFNWWLHVVICHAFLHIIHLEKLSCDCHGQNSRFGGTVIHRHIIYHLSYTSMIDELDLSILIIDLIFDTFKYSKMYQVNDNVNNTKVCLRHLKVYNIRVIFVNLIRCTMINTWHRQLDSFIIPAGSQINKIIPFP